MRRALERGVSAPRAFGGAVHARVGAALKSLSFAVSFAPPPARGASEAAAAAAAAAAPPDAVAVQSPAAKAAARGAVEAHLQRRLGLCTSMLLEVDDCMPWVQHAIGGGSALWRESLLRWEYEEALDGAATDDNTSNSGAFPNAQRPLESGGALARVCAALMAAHLGWVADATSTVYVLLNDGNGEMTFCWTQHAANPICFVSGANKKQRDSLRDFGAALDDVEVRPSAEEARSEKTSVVAVARGIQAGFAVVNALLGVLGHRRARAQAPAKRPGAVQGSSITILSDVCFAGAIRAPLSVALNRTATKLDSGQTTHRLILKGWILPAAARGLCRATAQLLASGDGASDDDDDEAPAARGCQSGGGDGTSAGAASPAPSKKRKAPDSRHAPPRARFQRHDGTAVLDALVDQLDEGKADADADDGAASPVDAGREGST
ncbi:hypothetical protein M885DRAFT_508124 [Pelagophyceae sp. CCMP2097]|nr:hypothetical protein M885DRAFT_508124 [Pelagophyceae sp. CCMP2097]